MASLTSLVPMLLAAGSAAAQPCYPHWEAVSPGLPPGAFVDWIEPSTGALGNGIYAGGEFAMAGSVPAHGIAFWDGVSWSALAGGLRYHFDNSGVTSMAIFDGGSGPALYVGGWFDWVDGVQSTGIARWDGSQWHTFGAGLTGFFPAQINAMIVHDDGTGLALYVSGSFQSIGGVPASGVARWNGAAWSAVGGPNPHVTALASFDDSSGSKLYAGGTFSLISGVAAEGVARWNGTAWEPIGLGLAGVSSGGRVTCFAPFDDGSGTELYAGGAFTSSGTTPLHWVARWNGSEWLDVAGGVSNGASVGFVEQLLTFDDGFGEALYACGAISEAGGQAARGIARYRRGAWSAVDGSASSSVYAMNSWVDGPTPSLYVGGHFTSLGGMEAMNIGRWTSCPRCYPNCDLSITPPILNVGDFICFLNRFAAGDSYANCDHSTTPPVLNIQDFSCFLNQFAAGCP